MGLRSHLELGIQSRNWMELTSVLCSSLIVCMSKHGVTFMIRLPLCMWMALYHFPKWHTLMKSPKKDIEFRWVTMPKGLFGFNKRGLYTLTYAIISHNVCSCTHNKESSEKSLHCMIYIPRDHNLSIWVYTTIIIYCCQTFNPYIIVYTDYLLKHITSNVDSTLKSTTLE